MSENDKTDINNNIEDNKDDSPDPHLPNPVKTQYHQGSAHNTESGIKIDKADKTATGVVEPPDVYGPVNILDDALPDMLLTPRDKTIDRKIKTPTANECINRKKINWGVFTSTWLSVSAKNIDIRESLSRHSSTPKLTNHDIYHRDLDDYDDEIGAFENEDDYLQPYCDEVPTSLRIPDHLEGIKMRSYLHIASESGLKVALQGK